MEHRIIPRSEWGARYGSSGIKRALPVKERWLHHSVTVAPDLAPPWSDDYAAIRHIEDVGRQRFGSYGFPYTFAITPAGLIFEGHPIDQIGAHTQGHNTVGAGIVFVGNYETDQPTRQMLHALDWLLNEGVRRGWWGIPTLTGGHRDTKATACPGRFAYALIDDINAGQFHEEDEVLTERQEELLEKAAKAGWVMRRIGGSVKGQSVHEYIKRIDQNTRKAVRQNAALTAAIKALAENSGVDPERVYAIVDTNVKEALEDVEITLSAKEEEQ